MIRYLKIVLLAVFITSLGASAQIAEPKVFLHDGKILKSVKESIVSGKKDFQPALKKLIRDAEKALQQKPVSVIEKKQVPPSGDKHDYMSVGKYWWPDPSKPDGKPFIRKDGEVYPGTSDIMDNANFSKMYKAVKTLALAYYFTDNESYAEHAAKLLKVWFLDAETKMNPNMNYAQAVTGKNDGRGSGIIDIHGVPELIDAVCIIQGSKSWSDKEEKDLEQWFKDYLKWMMESKNGIDEAKTKNNHGSWYDVQAVSVALFTGNSGLASKIIKESKTKRIATQIEPDGKQPKELVRTTSMHYSMFNIEALMYLSTLGEKTGEDLWNFKTPDGRGIKTAIDFMTPFLSGEKKWEYKQIKKFELDKYYQLFRKAYLVYKDKQYLDLIKSMKSVDKKSHISNLLLIGED